MDRKNRESLWNFPNYQNSKPKIMQQTHEKHRLMLPSKMWKDFYSFHVQFKYHILPSFKSQALETESIIFNQYDTPIYSCSSSCSHLKSLEKLNRVSSTWYRVSILNNTFFLLCTTSQKRLKAVFINLTRITSLYFL